MVDFTKLAEPFPVEQVSWRPVGKRVNDTTAVAAFLDARDIMGRLDDVCGPADWRTEYVFFGPTCICRLLIRINNEWVGKEDGAGVTDFEAEKGQISSALKRAAVCWGIGRYLYDVKDPNTGKIPYVGIDAGGNIPYHAIEYLYTLLPNNKGGLKLVSLPGATKTDGVFWQGKSYNILDKMPKNLKDGHGDPSWQDPATIAWLHGTLPKFITKCPSKLGLVKLQCDNSIWMRTYLDTESLQGLNDMFAVRAAEFDQLGGQDAKEN